jgi:hypothetical protein
VVTATVLLSACASSPEPENAPAPAPAAEVVAAPPPAAVMAPSAAAGSYRLRTELQRQSAQASRGRTPAETPLTLSATPSAAPQMGAPATTFNATVQIPGYTQAPRGRSAQAAAWWSVPGDSVVVQFARQNGDFVQLRGKKEGTALRGEVWYLSMESGATFQLGTFTATRQAAR